MFSFPKLGLYDRLCNGHMFQCVPKPMTRYFGLSQQKSISWRPPDMEFSAIAHCTFVKLDLIKTRFLLCKTRVTINVYAEPAPI